MLDQPFYTLRCAKCTCHFANIVHLSGTVKIEKKCPKCKYLNTINLSEKEINIQCRLTEDGALEYNNNIDGANPMV